MDALIERAHRGEASEDQLARLAAWRAADAANERHYRRLLRLLEASAGLRAELGEARAPAAAALLEGWAHAERAAGSPAEASSSRTSPPRRLGASEGSGGWPRRLPWGIAAAAVLALLASVLRPAAGPSGAPAYAAEVVTAAGEIVTVGLADGSVVRLAPSSRLRLGEAGDGRAVSLDGRAFFSVAQVEGRPFRVRTRAATATVLGTRFELAADADELRLVVVEGRVALEAPANRVEVAAGQASGVSNGTAATPTALENTDDVLRWAGMFLAFRDTPLRTAAREIGATYGVAMTITDSTLARQTITAVFTGHSLDAVLSVLCPVVNAECAVRANEVTLSPR